MFWSWPHFNEFFKFNNEVVDLIYSGMEHDSGNVFHNFEILGWCQAGPVLPHGEKVPL